MDRRAYTVHLILSAFNFCLPAEAEHMKQNQQKIVRKWLNIPRMLTSVAIYGKSIALQLLLSSVVEEFRVAKCNF